MARLPKPTQRKLPSDNLSKADSPNELSFSYLFDCLQEANPIDGFLGFTVSRAYYEIHKSTPNNLMDLRNHFPDDVLAAILVFLVYGQMEKIIKWTNKEKFEDYLRRNGANIGN